VKLRKLASTGENFAEDLEALLAWDMGASSDVDLVVAEIIAQVRTSGDDALLAYTKKFDRVLVDSVSQLEVGQEALAAAWSRIGASAQEALQVAAQRIKKFHEKQVEASWSFEDEMGNRLGQNINPIQSVGVYVPGGRAAYPSSVLMTLVPAKVAAVGQVVVTVPTPDGVINDMVLAALYLTQADRVFTIGGAQAIAAMAYGTQTIPKVDKIVGPGSAFVAAAKKQVFGQVGIDMIAGPSEVLVIADGSTPVEWAVLDLFSQCEHDSAAQSILLSPDEEFIDAVAAKIEEMLPDMEREQIIVESLNSRGALIHCKNAEEAIAIANKIAPEHLELAVADPLEWSKGIINAGAIFMGAETGETFGDYIAGPSHVLPTFGTARFASPLGVYDFQKRSSVIHMSAHGAADLAAQTDLLATSEGLQAHALAARVRGDRFKGNTD
jgi:histidinol dehydrogenase